MTKPTLLALDIDGVFNSRRDHDLIVEYINLCRAKGIEPNPEELTHLKFYEGIKFGDFVRREDLTKIKMLQMKYGFDVLYISAWFSRVRRNLQELYDFFGLDNVAVSPATNGGIQRPKAVLEYAEANDYQHVIVLDDMTNHYVDFGFYCDQYDNSNHIAPKVGMTSLTWKALEGLLERNQHIRHKTYGMPMSPSELAEHQAKMMMAAAEMFEHIDGHVLSDPFQHRSPDNQEPKLDLGGAPQRIVTVK